MTKIKCRKITNFLLLTILSISGTAFSQNSYPTDYFRSPLDIPLVLSGTFGELRSNHFHSGIDIKTQGVQGKKIYSIADGYISRIKVSPWGYGKALYIRHPNGYTSVYGHMKGFNEKIDQYVKEMQYSRESFDIELYPDANRFPLTKGDIIGLSGNSGGSGGPHLHFEIRDTRTEKPINPILFGFDIADSKPPSIGNVYIYPVTPSSTVNSKNEREGFNTVYKGGGTYVLKGTKPIVAGGTIGFGIEAYDQLDGAYNKNGIYSIELFIDDELHYSHKMETFAFGETRYINCLIDYSEKECCGRKIQKCYIEDNNQLSIYGEKKNRGYAFFNDNEKHHVRYLIKDTKGNTSTVQFDIQSTSFTPPTIVDTTEAIDSNLITFQFNKVNHFKTNQVELYLPEDALYHDIDFEYHMSNEVYEDHYSHLHTIHNSATPVHKKYVLSIRAVNIPKKHIHKAIIVSKDSKGSIASEGGKWDSGFITTSTRTFGDFYITIDSIPPTIKPINIYAGKNMSKNTQLIMKIGDNLSGIETYRGEVDGKWILMDYDAKNARLTYYFDEHVQKGKHTFTLYVTDGSGNKASYEAKFTR